MMSRVTSSPGLSRETIRGRSALSVDLLAVDGGDHVAAGVDLAALEADLLVARLQAGVVGGRAGDDLGDQRAGVGVDAEPVGELRIERLRW